MQMYRGLPIITNKLSIQEQKGIPHHLLGSIELHEDPWTVTHFKKEATRIISEIRARGKLPIVVGGTSYYLDGLLFEGRLVDEQSPVEGGTSSRDDLAEKYPILNGPPDSILAKLREVDPVMADKWHPNDIRKIRTSLEIYYATGRPASEIYAEQRSIKESKSASPGSAEIQSLGEILLFWLYARREVLNERLDKRVDKMVQDGLLRETGEVHDYRHQRLTAGGTVDLSKGIWQSIGYRQFEPYHNTLKETPDSPNLEKLKHAGIEETKAGTRQYAKYQVRWVTSKTLPSLQDDKLLDRFYLLDSTDIQRWNDEVLNKGVELAQKFLADEELPQPVDVSETAREVLTETIEKSNQQPTPCRKACDVCKKTLLTEELWHQHITSKKHHKALQAAKKRMLLPAHCFPSKAVVAVEADASGATS